MNKRDCIKLMDYNDQDTEQYTKNI